MEIIDCRAVDKVVSGIGNKYIHPNAKRTGSCSEGCCDEYWCPDCDSEWTEEGAD